MRVDPLDRHHDSRLILGVGISLAIIIIASTIISAFSLRESSRAEWSQEMSNLTLVLAEHASQTFFSAEVALDSIEDVIKSAKLKDSRAYEQLASSEQSYADLKEKISSNPIIEVASFVSNTGEVLNSTREFPPRELSVADRDYFNKHLSGTSNGTYYSAPFKTRAQGSWVFYLSRRVVAGDGTFLGVIVVGVSAELFSKFYERIGNNMGNGASISLYKKDNTLMTRWPFVPNLIGTRNASDSADYHVIEKQRPFGVEIVSAPRLTQGNLTTSRMVASRSLERYPFVVTSVITENLYLANWVKSVRWIWATAAFSMSLLAISIVLLLKANRKINQELAERTQAQEALSRAHEELEQRVKERTHELTLEIAERRATQEELSRVNAHIAEVSHRAGMAEVANSVLHNIGNVLNSVNVSVSVIREQLKVSPLNKLPPAADMLKQHSNNLADFFMHDEKGKLFPRFLDMLSSQWQKEHQTLLSETTQLRDSVQHINDIISKQQSLSGQLGVNEMFNVAELIRSTFNFHESSFTKSNIDLAFDLKEDLVWNGDRSKFTQIMLNLIVNAEESLIASSSSPLQLSIISRLTKHGDLEIKVIDNGCGIAPEVMKKLFSYGFTTKATGHGFGLHASALAAQEMGGKLEAFSQGVGHGATFTLSIPPSATERPVSSDHENKATGETK
jgi:signal transduction histidine kinase